MNKLERKYSIKDISLNNVRVPDIDFNDEPVVLSDQTFAHRREKLLERMRESSLDIIFVYADREHGSNFEYLTGFIPRFEEALLTVELSGKTKLFLGNENMKLAKHSRTKAEAVHTPYFSLTNQPMGNTRDFKGILQSEIDFKGKNIGIVGWKVFTSKFEDNNKMFDVPYFIVNAISELAQVNSSKVTNCTDIFIGENGGIRTINNAEEIRYYEFGSSLSSDCVLEAMNNIEVGKTETEIASYLSRFGQPHNITTICATGERFTNADIYPRKKQISLGDKFSITTGYKGGLTSRAGYVAKETKDLPSDVQDYLERLAIPYYLAVVVWMENIRIGMTGGQMYEMIETVFQKEKYNWELNPGHLTSDEEWMSSPIYCGSNTELKSGMLFQIDIIPSLTNYAGASAESGIALADAKLRKQIAEEYPELWERFKKRRAFIQQELNIQLHPEVLLLSNTVGYYRPYMLNKEKALLFNSN